MIHQDVKLASYTYWASLICLGNRKSFSSDCVSISLLIWLWYLSNLKIQILVISGHIKCLLGANH